MTVSRFGSHPRWGGVGVLPLLLLTSALGFAGTRPSQETLQGDWSSVGGAPQDLTFVPTGPNAGQVGFGSQGMVDYHYYRLIGRDTIRINDGQGVYRLRLQGERLVMSKPGSRRAKVFMRRSSPFQPGQRP